MPKLAKLASHDAIFAGKIDVFSVYASKLGATAGIQRLILICQNFNNLSPEVAYNWLDPHAIQQEVETAQLRATNLWYTLRNILSILPLILTWLALFYAANEYKQDLLVYHNDIYSPFLELWQNGFHGQTFFTFGFAAFLDFSLLACYLFCIIVIQRIEHKAEAIAVEFAKEASAITEQLMALIATEGNSHIQSASDVDTVANAVKRVVDRSIDANQQMNQAHQASLATLNTTFQTSLDALNSKTADFFTQQVIPTINTLRDTNIQIVQSNQATIAKLADIVQKSFDELNTKTNDLYTQQIIPMMTTFRQDIVTLSATVNNNQKQMTDLTSSIATLGGASQQLATNADKYVNIGVDINEQIKNLNATQKQVIQAISLVTSDMTAASKSIEIVAKELTLGTKQDIETMVMHITRGADAMRQVEQQLGITTQHLEHAAEMLSEVEIGGGSGGLTPIIPWMIGRTTKKLNI